MAHDLSEPVLTSSVVGSPVGSGPKGAGGEATSPAQYVPVAAMEDILAVRHEQIFRHGHTPEKDAARSIYSFVREIHDQGKALHETVQFNKGTHIARRRAVKLAAMCMALIDRIDIEGENL